MLEWHEFQLRVGVEGDTLQLWIAEGWLIPQLDQTDRRFSEIDVARANLIRDLRRDLGVNDEGVGVILDLVDQIHGLRRTVRALIDAAKPSEADDPASLA